MDQTKPQASRRATRPMKCPEWVSSAKKRNRHCIHLSEKRGESAQQRHEIAIVYTWVKNVVSQLSKETKSPLYTPERKTWWVSSAKTRNRHCIHLSEKRGESAQQRHEIAIVYTRVKNVVSQLSKETKSPLYTPERKTWWVSSAKTRNRHCIHLSEKRGGSEQTYSQKPRHSATVTQNTDPSEEELSNDANKSQHSDLDETEIIYQHNIPKKRKWSGWNAAKNQDT